MSSAILSAFICVRGKELSAAEGALLRKYRPAGITLFRRNIDTPEQTQKLIEDIRTAVNNDILIAIDQEGGRVCRLDPPYWHHYAAQQQLGALPPEQAKQAITLHACLIAHDLRKLGVNIVFAPVADVAHADTTAAIISRCFSNNPQDVAKDATLLARTYMENGICPCMKHLPGHGLATTDPHLSLPVIKAKLEQIKAESLPFQEMSSFIPMGMTAHIIVPDIDKTKPITQSPQGIAFIRNTIGFQGWIISDAIEMHALSGTLAQKTKASLDAGCDCVCFCSGHNQDNPYLVEENTAVLQAATPLSDLSLQRLSKIYEITQRSYVCPDNLAKMQETYDALIAQSPVKEGDLKTPQKTTEGWHQGV